MSRTLANPVKSGDDHSNFNLSEQSELSKHLQDMRLIFKSFVVKLLVDSTRKKMLKYMKIH